jgi:uncharacterized protein YkwD
MEPFDPNKSEKFRSVEPIEGRIHELANDARTERDLEPLNYDPDLTYLGRVHARDMAQRDFFAHTNPDDETPQDRMEKYGLDETYWAVRENIAQARLGEDTAEAVAESVFDLWKNSDGHWNAILGEHSDRQGTGVYLTEDNWLYAAMELGQLENAALDE